jgi:hypothetical protein
MTERFYDSMARNNPYDSFDPFLTKYPFKALSNLLGLEVRIGHAFKWNYAGIVYFYRADD